MTQPAHKQRVYSPKVLLFVDACGSQRSGERENIEGNLGLLKPRVEF